MTRTSDHTLWTDQDTAIFGTSSMPWSATGVSIDTRTILPGDLFIALQGPSFDGHDFVREAEMAGAAAVMVAGDKIDAFKIKIPVLSVDNTITGLESLARVARARSTARIIGVTGSVGKTGTKEALRLALATNGIVHATEGNLNNHLGLPLSLARLPLRANFSVLEMGMSAPGEITPLSRMAQPHVVIITEIAEVHSEYFESVQEIAAAKAEIFEGLVKYGVAILNRDNKLFKDLSEYAHRSGVAQVFTFGEHEAADARLLSYTLEEASSFVEVAIAGERLSYEIGAPGKHLVLNSLSVLAAVQAIGDDPKVAAGALKGFKAPKGRGQRREIFCQEGSFVMIDESYNASPASMTAAIGILSAAKPRGAGRRVAVIGDMLELGPRSEALHADLAEPLTAGGIDLVFTAGLLTTALQNRLPPAMRGGHAVNAKDLAPLVADVIGDGDVTMVKGSLGIKMTEVVEALDALGSQFEGPKEANGR